MPRGTCALCDLEKELKLSHFLPRAFYPSNLVYTTRSISGRIIGQMKQYLLCENCECLFNTLGETPASKWIAPNKKTFPLLGRLSVALPVAGSKTADVFSSSAIGVSTDEFGYFILSILWRAAVAEWVLPDRTVTTKIGLGSHFAPIKAYLAGKGGFPSDTVIMLTVCDDPFSRGWLARPNKIKNISGFLGFECLTRGVYFHVLLGKAVPPRLRRLCCVSWPDRYIFRRSCGDKSIPAYVKLSQTARKVGKWAKESNGLMGR
jgi:hypothetical protein